MTDQLLGHEQAPGQGKTPASTPTGTANAGEPESPRRSSNQRRNRRKQREQAAVCVRLFLWSPSAREIEFVPAVIDLGKVREQQRLKTEFTIRFSVPFRAQVSPAFVVTPDVLVFDSSSQVGSIVSLTLRGCEPFRVAEVRLPDCVSLQDQPREHALSHTLAIVLTEIRNGSLGELAISLVGASGRRGNVVVRVGRVSDGIGGK